MEYKVGMQSKQSLVEFGSKKDSEDLDEMSLSVLLPSFVVGPGFLETGRDSILYLLWATFVPRSWTPFSFVIKPSQPEMF